MKIRSKLVCSNVQLCIWRQFVIFYVVVLVSFYPVGAEGPSEFFVEISNDEEVVDVIWLLCGSIVFTDDKSDAVDCHFAIDEPSELASVRKSPISSEECNKEEWCCEPAKFASGGAAYVDGSVNRACALVENLMLVGCDCPAECSTHWKQASIGCDDEATAGSKRSPYVQVGALLIVGEEETPVPLAGQGRKVCLGREVLDWSRWCRRAGNVSWWLAPFIAVA